MSQSTVGRPRKLTDEQVATILAWHRARQTVREFAEGMGLSVKLVSYTIKRGGHYKKPSPELHQAAVQARREKIDALMRCGWM